MDDQDRAVALLRGLRELRRALAEVWTPPPAPAPAFAYAGAALPSTGRRQTPWLATEAVETRPMVLADVAHAKIRPADRYGDADQAVSSAENEAEATRIIALVELARGGDKDAFGELYDHYHLAVFRFLYYRVSSTTLAEDLTAETFFRALRAMDSFRWQGKDFGAWLMTIARNLTADHFKAGRTRLEQTTEDLGTLDSTTDGPEGEVLSSLTNETLLAALADLPAEQRDCLVMRFLEGMSIAETADVQGRSSGAVKQLQLRGVRNLKKLLPESALQ